MNRFFERLEDPKYPLLGPTLWGLQKLRAWNLKKSGFIINPIHILTLFIISQFVELWLIRSNLELALKNLSFTMFSSTCAVKVITFICWRKQWKEVIDYVSNLEKQQMSKNDDITNKVIKEYTMYSRRVTYLYWCLVTGTVITVCGTPLIGYAASKKNRDLIKNGSVPYPEILSSWIPFDRTREYSFWLLIVEHTAIVIYGAGIVAIYDSNAVVIMSFFTAQLKLLSINCARLFDGQISYDQAMKRIKECHFHHVYLVKFSTIFNSVLSPVMFFYVIICSIMICASATQITQDGTTNMQRIWIAEYLLALIAQLFLYCWHSNEMLSMSYKVESGVYKSDWLSQNVRVRRSLLLLGGQLRKQILFRAGPFTDLNVATFVSILKLSYSYYTLMSQKLSHSD